MATDSDKLRAWKDTSDLLCLDLRPLDEHQAKRLRSSTCIPWKDLSLRCAELPAKSVPFAVLIPFSNHPALTWLPEHGWDCTWVFDASQPPFWEAAEMYGLVCRGPDEGPPALLFRPCPFLAAQLPLIQAAKNGTSLSCLDIGCGSGRDTAYLLTRGWHVDAIDSLPNAVERTLQLATHMRVHAKLEAWQVKIMANGAWHEQKNMREGIPKEERFAPGVPMDVYFSGKQYDLVLTIRFLVKTLLPDLPRLVKPGGYLLISHFVEDGSEYRQPRKEHRVQLNELSSLYGAQKDLEVVIDVIEKIEDGRPVNSVLIRKKTKI
ncbi:S-adenosyl-L-methionine-dependent methyltransferase [Syncephalastrum racemosum]|uniref:S-adenosyl-L-methionine-dependent methyltransferase n=1 Tax=Syncephalastrum racemosum TaxID=13706 RepID=A0A1X2HU55_SYNRA|nr:S-adenosyl-L-methionine-dependent methyltransferase [Syncephalastrum racemosum]